MKGLDAVARKLTAAGSRDRADRERLAALIGHGQEQLRALFELSPVGIIQTDAEARILTANGVMEQMLDYRPGELAGVDYCRLVDGGDQGRLREATVALRGGFVSRWWGELTLVGMDGRRVPTRVAATVARDGSGRVERVIGTHVDICELVSARQALALTRRAVQVGRRELDATQHLAGVGSWYEDDVTGEMVASAQLTALLAMPGVSRRSDGLSVPLIGSRQPAMLMAGAEGSEGGEGGEPAWTVPSRDVSVLDRDGQHRILEVRGKCEVGPDGGPGRTFGTVQDVTAVRAVERRLRDGEARDRQLLQAMPDAVIVTDPVGRIEDINAQAVNLFGYARDELVGRPVEVLVPPALRRAHRTHRVAYIAATDPGVLDTGPGIVAIHKDGTSIPVEIHLARIELTTGAAVLATVRDLSASRTRCTPDAQARDPDAVSYLTKDHGRSRYQRADPESRACALRRITMEADLRLAIDGDQLRLVYQPCLDLGTGDVVAVEALLRWEHPSCGLLAPVDFLDVAEDRDLITPLGAWVIDTACRQAAAWRQRFGDTAPQMWVNISSRQLGDHRLTRTVADALAASGLPADQLCLEVTDRQIYAAAHAVRADLFALPDIGVQLAIDDFGTGHQGMDYLRDIPISTLKIDKSFIAGLGVDRTGTSLTTSVMSLARCLDVTVVAEGVETVDQRRRLSALGCRFAQGYLLARPGPGADIEKLLSS